MQSGVSTYAMDVKDIEYVRHEGRPLLARMYLPLGDGPFPMMIDLHGGAWCSGDRHNDKLICEALARSGVIVAALDFRQPPEAGYPEVMSDIHFAIRWLKSNAARFNGKPDAVGIIGISSGGQQAMLLALTPDDQRFAAIDRSDVSADNAHVGCVVLCWPVIDPLGRYHYAQQRIAANDGYPAQLAGVVANHDRYWGSEDMMADGSPVRLLERDTDVTLAPVLYVQGGADEMHPRGHLNRFVELYRERGGVIDLALYEGEVEGFVTRTPRLVANQTAAVNRIIGFVHQHLD